MNNHMIIGLGGTGGKIIREFKKSIFQNFRQENPKDVFVDYLYVDSSREFMDPKDPSWKILGTSVQLGLKNQCVIEGTNLHSILDSIDDFPGIKPWIGNREQWKDILTAINAPTVLGGQKRRLGRFLFANKVDEFKSQLTKIVSDLQNESGNIPVKFHICCGLAGGTGSGSIVDVLCQIRNLYQDSTTYEILVYALLPDQYPKQGWDTGNYHANGYAALAELNAISVDRWMPHDISGETDKFRLSDPFNGCYVFENKNENGHIVDVENELPIIVADFLYMKLISVSHSGGWVRTLERIENGENGDASPETTPSGHDNTPERSKRFLSFGIKRLAIPEEEIREYLTYTFSEQASLKLLYENWKDGEGFINESKNLPFHQIVRDKDNLERWKLTSSHLCLSAPVLENDFNNKKWLRIEEDWQTVIPKFQQAVKRKYQSDKRSWVNHLKSMCSEHYNSTFRGYGVKQFFKARENDKSQIADEIKNGIEDDLFEKWKSSIYSAIDIGIILEAMIAHLNERLRETDGRMQDLSAEIEKIEEDILSNDQAWSQVNFFGDKIFKKLDNLFDAQATYHQTLYTKRTQHEAWRFAKALLPEIITRLEDMKIEVDKIKSTLRQAIDQYKVSLKELCSDSDSIASAVSKHFIRFYEPEKVKGLSSKFRVNESMQRTQAGQVRNTVFEKLGNSPNFKIFNERIKLPDYLDLADQKCQETAERAHDEQFATTPSQKLLGVSIIEKLYDKFSNDQEALRTYMSDLVNNAGNYLKISNNEKQRSGLGIPKVDTCVSNFTCIVPESQQHARFLSQVDDALQRSRRMGAEIIHTDQKRNEITLVSIMNLFPVRFIDSIFFLKGKYDRRIKKSDPERAKLELHIESDGSQLPSLLLLGKEDIGRKAIPYVILSDALGLIEKSKNNSTGKMDMVLVTKTRKGTYNPSINLGSSLTEAVETVDLKTFHFMKEHVEMLLSEIDVEKRKDIKSFVIELIEEMKSEFGPGHTTFEKFSKGANQALNILGE